MGMKRVSERRQLFLLEEEVVDEFDGKIPLYSSYSIVNKHAMVKMRFKEIKRKGVLAICFRQEKTTEEHALVLK